jgi:CheY-like chemotaxis protein
LFKPLKPNELLAALTLAFGSPPPPLHAPRRDNIFDQMPHDGQTLSILLAEDNMVNQKVTLLTLNRLGYRVDVAASGLEVLDAFRRQAYDIVLMDIHMPDMDGIEATRRLLAERAPGQQPYIIAITAAAMREDRERCRAAGMHNFISKPVKVEELVGILTQARAWLAERVPQ